MIYKILFTKFIYLCANNNNIFGYIDDNNIFMFVWYLPSLNNSDIIINLASSSIIS